MTQQLIKEFYGDRMLVFGHRGARAYAPMNTIPSFELALAQGADGVELDVRLTSDLEMVIMHDDRVDATTDAKGFIHEMTLAEIKELDAGSWLDPKYAGTRVPTLDEVFEAIGKRTKINVEIKAETTDDTGIEGQVADAIRRHGLARTIIVSSFNPLTLARFRQVMPEVLIGFLHEPENEAITIPMMNELPHEARNPYYEEIDAKYMAWAKGAGYRVNTWTVNDAKKAVELRDLGVDCIITDKPDVILAAVRA
jgi:glycerophosphoryl diester phosphodiesterase